MLIVVAILGVIAVLAVPSYQKAQIRSKAMTEGENLRLIESAKSQFARANPGKPIGSVLAGDGTPVDLAPFLPNSKLPVSPWGVTYANVLDLANPVTSSANGDASKEPPVQPLSANGYNDVLASDRVYYKVPGTDAWVQPPAPPLPPVVTGTGTGSGTGTGTGCTGSNTICSGPTSETKCDSHGSAEPEQEDKSYYQKQKRDCETGEGSKWEPDGDLQDGKDNRGLESHKWNTQEGGNDTGLARWINKHWYSRTQKEVEGGPGGHAPSVTPSSNPCCPGDTHTVYSVTCTWEWGDWDWHDSPVIVDIFSTGDIRQLAPHGWQLGRKDRPNPFLAKWFEMVPGDLRLWEWVTPKAGILVHGVGAASGSAPPIKVDGSNLFGTNTWGGNWKHGYEPMVKLDKNSDGFLAGSELGDLWIWIDANSDAKPDPDEFKPAEFYVSVLAVIPLPGRDSYCPKGARLISGEWVTTWDWWSGTVSKSSRREVLPTRKEKSLVTLYHWKQTDRLSGQPGDLFEGYFLFGEFYGELVVASISSSSKGLTGSCSVIELVEADKLRWMFGAGNVVTNAQLAPKDDAGDGDYSVIRGESILYLEKSQPKFFWEARQLTEIPDDFAASLSSMDFQSLQMVDAINKGEFLYEPVQKKDAAPAEFSSLSDLMNRLNN